ncbi:MAG: DNA repair protein RecO [Dehalococcoidia bacterium]|nr:DNA repair protein RecO [Dehalococcoidia bacterium]
MVKHHLYKTEAVVLRRRDLGEADKILVLYTPHLGRLSAVAKGVRKPSSRLGGHVELLAHSAMMLAQGRNLDIVSQSQIVHSFPGLRDNLERVAYGFYVAELVERFTGERIENQPLFRLLLNMLSYLEETPNPDLATRHFELHLLDLVGYRPELQRCISCNIELRPVSNFFSPASGGTLCPNCGPSDGIARPLSLNALKVLRLLQDTAAVSEARLRLDRRLSRELEGLLTEYISYLLEGEVRSMRFLRDLRRQAIQPA